MDYEPKHIGPTICKEANALLVEIVGPGEKVMGGNGKTEYKVYQFASVDDAIDVMKELYYDGREANSYVTDFFFGDRIAWIYGDITEQDYTIYEIER